MLYLQDKSDLDDRIVIQAFATKQTLITAKSKADTR